MDADAAPTGRRAFVLRLLSGPAAFAAVRAAPLAGLAPEAHFVLAAYACITRRSSAPEARAGRAASAAVPALPRRAREEPHQPL